jgi:hypothetical protein
MNKLIFASMVSLFCLEVQADIAPDPIRAKGIAINEPTEIKMTYEKVVVNLTLDSSFVYCYFRLHNEGKARKIQIGYPNMSYYSYSNQRRNFTFNPINVNENGTKLNYINFFTPDSINLRNNDNNNKPWYLWDTYFDENETKVIIVSYSLPHGIVKNNLYYKFDYLLSTGAGWKGKIDTAEIIVNLKNFDKDLILKTSTANFTTSDKQLIWKLYDLEPSSKDDISISYEEKKGQYEERLNQLRSPVYILNDKDILSNDIRNENSVDNAFKNIGQNELASIDIISDPKIAKNRFPKINSSNGLFLLYTKKYSIDKFIGIINSRLKGKNDKIKFNSIPEFEENYSLIINMKTIQKGIPFYEEIMKINKDKIIDISIKGLDNSKYDINIRSDQ